MRRQSMRGMIVTELLQLLRRYKALVTLILYFFCNKAVTALGGSPAWKVHWQHKRGIRFKVPKDIMRGALIDEHEAFCVL